MDENRRYTLRLADTVVQMFANGIIDPSAAEIADAHFAPQSDLGTEIAEGIRQRLIKIRDIVEEIHGIPCALVSEVYYVRFRVTPPTEIRDAYLCIPGGYGKGRHGIRKHDGDGDMIWRATQERNLISAGGKEKKSVDRVLAAVATGDVSNENALALIGSLREAAEPDRPEIIAQLFDQLDDGSQPELGPGEE